jgi:hypothetical protein
MRRTRLLLKLVVPLALWLGIGLPNAGAIPVDLNTFDRVPDPLTEDVIVIQADGSQAVLGEALSGDTFLLKPDLVLPQNAISLSFHFDFLEPDPSWEDNAFRAVLYDPGSCDPGLDPSCAFFTAYYDTSSSADLTWDVTSTSLPGSTAALSFGLLFGNFDVDLGSTLEIASLEINERVSQVPEPSSLVLLASGLGTALVLSRSLSGRARWWAGCVTRSKGGGTSVVVRGQADSCDSVSRVL